MTPTLHSENASERGVGRSTSMSMDKGRNRLKPRPKNPKMAQMTKNSPKSIDLLMLAQIGLKMNKLGSCSKENSNIFQRHTKIQKLSSVCNLGSRNNLHFSTLKNKLLQKNWQFFFGNGMAGTLNFLQRYKTKIFSWKKSENSWIYCTTWTPEPPGDAPTRVHTGKDETRQYEMEKKCKMQLPKIPISKKKKVCNYRIFWCC